MTSKRGHETEDVRIEARIPKHLRNKTACEIVRYCQKHWATQTRLEKSTGKTIMVGLAPKMLKATADAVFDPNNWKNPFYTIFPEDSEGRGAREWVEAAVIWYHGKSPYTTYVGVGSTGYACW